MATYSTDPVKSQIPDGINQPLVDTIDSQPSIIPASGIVGDAMAPSTAQEAPPAAAPAEPYKAPEVQPITTQVDVPTETVESRLSDITAEGSRYTDLAKRDAIREANTRGLINTTMAGAAGTEASIRAALPIAQQDAKTFTDTRMANQAAENTFLRNRQSANLNMEVAAMDSELKTNFEKTMQDERFSDEVKIQMVTTMNSIVRDTQEQITQVGLSDRSAAQQAEAIKSIQYARDAELAVYQDLLGTFNDWEWGTDFTPTQTEAQKEAEEDSAAAAKAAAVAAAEADAAKIHRDPSSPPTGDLDWGGRGGLYSDDGKWVWSEATGQWKPTQ